MTQNQKQHSKFLDQNQTVSTKSRTFSNFISNSKSSPPLNRKIVKFLHQQVQKEIQKLQWRKRTDFPIVKIVDYHILNPIQNKDLICSSKNISIQITLEGILYSLTEVRQIPIFKMLYLIKQALIGTERLCSLYGNFQVNPAMIGIDGRRKCKIWHNSKFHLTQPEMPCISQAMTIRSLTDVFQSITRKSPKSTRFFRQLYNCNSFCECLNLLKRFAIQQKIRIPQDFLLSDKFSVGMFLQRKFNNCQQENQNNPQVQIEKKLKRSEEVKKLGGQNNGSSPKQVRKVFPCRLFKQKQSCSQKAIQSTQNQFTADTTLCQKNTSSLVKSQLTYGNKIDSLFTQNYLDVIESVFEGDQDSRFSDDFSDCHPLDYTIPPKNTPIWRSSSSYEKLSPETGSSEDLGSQQLIMSNWNYRYSAVNEGCYSFTDLDLI